MPPVIGEDPALIPPVVAFILPEQAIYYQGLNPDAQYEIPVHEFVPSNSDFIVWSPNAAAGASSGWKPRPRG